MIPLAAYTVEKSWYQFIGVNWVVIATTILISLALFVTWSVLKYGWRSNPVKVAVTTTLAILALTAINLYYESCSRGFTDSFAGCPGYSVWRSLTHETHSYRTVPEHPSQNKSLPS